MIKPSFLLLSLIGASTVAQAQSSVSLSGTVDVYANHVKGSLTSRSQVSSGGNSTSKLILRATEDLGGGLKAGFWLESGLGADTGTGQASNSNNQPSGTTTAPAGTQGLTFNRRSYLYLGGAWGELRLGREWSPTYETFTPRFDPFSVASGIAINYTASINANGVRYSNNIAYITPKFFGFSANLQHWFGENVSGTATSKDGSGEGARLYYEQGKLIAALAFARTHFAAGDAIYRNVAAAYDFGPVRLSAVVTHDQQAALKQEGALIGVTAPLGQSELKGTYSVLKTNATRLNPEAKKLALGYVYHLSKRSAIYTTVARIHNSKGSAVAFSGATTAANQSSTGVDVGIRHNF
jgi:predicted porin